MGAQLRVVVADDSLLFREGLVRVLGDLGFDTVAQAGSADELIAAVEATSPDLAVVDIRMPPNHTIEGIQAAATLAESHPDLAVVVLSQYVESDYAIRLLQEAKGRRGYLLKDTVADLDEFEAALRRVAAGGSVVDHAVIEALVPTPRQSGHLDQLSVRETEILTLMAEGLSNHGISERLVLSTRTVESHVRTIFGKLDLVETDDANRRVLAVLTYLRQQA